MSSLNAALLVVGLLLCVGGPMVWWVFYRMDNHPSPPPGEPLSIEPISLAEVSRIEMTLDVKLPEAYRNFLTSIRELGADGESLIDGESVLGDADMVISSTMEYRKGFAGLPPWPETFVYIGDEADACPYALNTKSGEVLRTDKGNFNRKPLAQYESFSDFISKFST